MADLDHVLDDALAGFDDDELDIATAVPSTSSAKQPAASSSQAVQSTPQPSSLAPPQPDAPSSSTPTPEGSSSVTAAPKASAPEKPKSLQFDPLKRRKAAGPGAGAGAGSSSSKGSGSSSGTHPALTPEISRLQDDLAHLVSEWSTAMHPEQGEGPAAAAAATGQQQQQQRQGAASVLQALQEQTQRTVEQQARSRPPPAAAAGAAAAAAGGGGGDDQQQMSMIVDVVMQHLLSKDVLYQPMKEIMDKYPPWLAQQAAGTTGSSSSSSSLSAADLERYHKQYECIKRLCEAYETQPGNTTHIMALLQEMQACGEPPEDIVADMSSSIAADLPGLAAAGAGAAGGSSPLADLNFDDLDLTGLADTPDLKNCPVQ